MSENKIQVEILTPERPLADEEASEVNFPAVDGYMGVLPQHTPLVAELGIGEVRLVRFSEPFNPLFLFSIHLPRLSRHA